ncbi:MAG: hypothetical protein FJ257_12945 [Phycisphaerae bacterium]|nr:hypothetical protein [Phycisphaerae bacterium]
MRSISRGGAAASILAAAGGLATASSSHAGVYYSIYTLSSPYQFSTPNATQALLTFSTSLTSGIMDAGDLDDWSISLLSGGNLFYTDHVVVDGAVQSIGGVSRSITDILFEFNLDTLVHGTFDNLVPGASLAAAVGTQFNIYSYPFVIPPGQPGPIPFGIWSNGNEATRQNMGFSSVVTIPAPATIALLAFSVLPARRRRD